jgi:hypothetical protein
MEDNAVGCESGIEEWINRSAGESASPGALRFWNGGYSVCIVHNSLSATLLVSRKSTAILPIR